MELQLWDRRRVEALKRGAFRFGEGMLAVSGYASPADGLQAAREILGGNADFSHINIVTGYLVYRAGEED